MLQSFRNNIKGAGAAILVGLIAIPFVFFGVDSVRFGGATDEVAEVNGEEITEQDVQRQLVINRQQLMDRFDGMDTSFLTDELLRKPAIDQLIGQKVLQQKAEASGMAVPLERIYDVLVEVPAYQLDGKFSSDRYEYAIRQMGFTPTSHARAIGGEMLERALLQGLLGSGIATSSEISHVVELSGQTRNFYYLTIPAANYQGQVSVDSEESRAYYDANLAQFITPETVQVEYVQVSQGDFEDELDIDESEISAAYQGYIADLQAVSTREVAHIFVDTSDEKVAGEKIAQITARLAAEEPFETIAAEMSDDAGSASLGGSLGQLAKGDLPEALEFALETMQEGEISGPVDSESGIHFLKLVAVQAGDIPALEEVRDQLVSRVKETKAREHFLARVEELREIAYNAATLQEAADFVGTPLKISKYFSRTGASEGIASYPKVVELAFSEDVLLNGYPSDVIELSDSEVLVLRVIEHKPESPTPFEDVKPLIQERLVARKVGELLRAEAGSLVEAIEAGNSLEDVAKEGAFEWQVGLDVARNAVNMESEVRDFAFSLPAIFDKSITEGFLKSDGDYVLLQLTGVSAGSAAQDISPAVVEQFSRVSATRETLGYQRSLIDAAEVKR
ncbi:MAG: SurA N-terminal domain-containing protein [bacterium]